MSTNPKFQDTPEYRELEAAAEDHRRRLEEGGHANAIEKSESMGVSMENVLGIADALKPAVEAFANLAKREEAFRAEWLPKIQAETQIITCQDHPHIMRPLDLDATFNAIRPTRIVTIIYAPCSECEKEGKAARKREYWRRHGVEERNLHATFAGFQCDTEEKKQAVSDVRQWCAARGNFLILIGKSGTGKGFLATAALKAQGSGLFVKHVDMLADLRASYQTHDTKVLIEKWQDCEMLALDEFGLSPGGRDEESLLYQVLADRYDKRRPTIITTNLKNEELRDALGARLLDRIRSDMKRVTMNWDSYRAQPN